MLLYLYKNKWIILERDCSARGEKKIYCSRESFTRDMLMQKRRKTDQKKKDGETSIFRLNRYKKNKKKRNRSSSLVKIEEKWHTHAHLNG